MSTQIHPANMQHPPGYGAGQQQMMMPASAGGGQLMSPQQQQQTMFLAPVTPAKMNPNATTISLDSDEKILTTFGAKDGCCHVWLPADEAVQTILTNKRIATSYVDSKLCCCCLPTGAYTRWSETYDLKDVAHISSQVTNVGWCGLTAIFTNIFCPPAARISISVSRPGSVVGWMNPVSRELMSWLMCHFVTVTGKEVTCCVKRQELQSVVHEMQRAVANVNKTQ